MIREPYSWHRAHHLRKGRYSLPNQLYHLCSVTHARTPIFDSLHHGRVVVKVLREMHDQGLADTLAFTVMPDHLHWLLLLGEKLTLSQVAGLMKSCVTKRLRQEQGLVGHVWQSGFLDRQLRPGESVLGVARYIVANPVRAGLVKSVRDYSLWDVAWL